MTDAQEPNWPNAPKTLIDAWFGVLPILYVICFFHAVASWLIGVQFIPGPLPSVLMIMLLDTVAITMVLCLNVASREMELPKLQKVIWGLLFFLIPPVACPAYYFMRMRHALFDFDAPPLGKLPKLVGGVVQLFVDLCLLQFAFVPVSVLAMARMGWSDLVLWGSAATPLFLAHLVLSLAAAAWCLVAGVWFCFHHLRLTEATRAKRIGWTVFLVLLPPIGIFWFYVRKLRRLVGGTVYLRESLLGRILFMRIWGKKR